jgi:type I restriction-modification system DNA methylase subunit
MAVCFAPPSPLDDTDKDHGSNLIKTIQDIMRKDAGVDGDDNYMKNGTLMRQVINKINGIDFNASDDRHMFGDIYR